MKNKFISVIVAFLLILLSFGTYKYGYFKGLKESEVKEVEVVKTEENNLDYDIRDLYSKVNFGDDIVYVIGHIVPDSDTVCSAIATAYLLNNIGIKAEARISGDINRETKVFLEYAGVNVPEILLDATDKNIFLVDHSSYSQGIENLDKANIVGIYDHHNVGDVTSSSVVVSQFAPIGSTCSIVYLNLKALNIPISKEIATVIIGGILSDTNNCMYSSATNIDKKVVEELVELHNIDRDDLNIKRLYARVDYSGLSDKDILLMDYKEYNVDDKYYGIGVCDTVGEDDSLKMIERMKKTMEDNYKDANLDYLFMMIHDYLTNKQYILSYGDGSKEVLEKAMNIKFDDYITLENSISRKVLVSNLNKTIANK